MALPKQTSAPSFIFPMWLWEKVPVTEITCHAKGAMALFGNEAMNVIDVGGQDTKVITCKGRTVEEFFMNDKCSAGTGKFL